MSCSSVFIWCLSFLGFSLLHFRWPWFWLFVGPETSNRLCWLIMSIGSGIHLGKSLHHKLPLLLKCPMLLIIFLFEHHGSVLSNICHFMLLFQLFIMMLEDLILSNLLFCSLISEVVWEDALDRCWWSVGLSEAIEVSTLCPSTAHNQCPGRNKLVLLHNEVWIWS